jgi:hypothetical protein
MLPVKQTTSDTTTSTAHTAVSITYAALAGLAHAIHSLIVSYHGGTASGELKVEDGVGTTVFSIVLPAAGVYIIPFPVPLLGSKNTALVVTLADGGASVIGKINAQHSVY